MIRFLAWFRAARLRRRALRWLFGAVPFILAGCLTSQKMVTHFAVADLDQEKPTLKFYRVTVDASSSNLKSTLRTGYYDANALRDAFGEVRASGHPRDGSKEIGTVAFAYDPASKSWHALPADELFTVIYGADAQALEASIKAFADSDEAGKTLGRLLAAAAGKTPFLEATEAEEKLKKKVGAAKKIAASAAKESAAAKAAADKFTAPPVAASDGASSGTSSAGTSTAATPTTTASSGASSGTSSGGATSSATTTGGMGSSTVTASTTSSGAISSGTSSTQTGTTSATGTPSGAVASGGASTGTTSTAAPSTSPTAAVPPPTPAEIDALLLRIAKVTIQQLGSAVELDGDAGKAFAQLKELHGNLAAAK